MRIRYEYTIRNYIIIIQGEQKMKANCLKCKYLNISDEKRQALNIKIPNKCIIYKVRLDWKKADFNAGYYISPCKQCIESNFVNFIQKDINYNKRQRLSNERIERRVQGALYKRKF